MEYSETTAEWEDYVDYLDKKYSLLIKKMMIDLDVEEKETWKILDEYRKEYGYPDA